MILSLKERFLQSIVAMILFIKVMIAIHTMIIYITCKKTNWCTFSRSYPTLRTFFAFLPTLTHRLRVSSQQKENFCLPKVLFLFIQAAGDKPSAWYIIKSKGIA